MGTALKPEFDALNEMCVCECVFCEPLTFNQPCYFSMFGSGPVVAHAALARRTASLRHQKLPE